MDDRPHGAEVSVGGISLSDSLEGSFRPQMILKRSHDVAAAGGHRLVFGLCLGFGGQWGHGQAEAGWAAVVGTWLAAMAVKKRFRIL